MMRWISKLLGRPDAPPLDCHQVGEMLQYYLDGEIDAVRDDKIAAHLDACRQCGLEAETYERIRTALAGRRPDVSAESIARLREFGERLARGEGSTAD